MKKTIIVDIIIIILWLIFGIGIFISHDYSPLNFVVAWGGLIVFAVTLLIQDLSDYLDEREEQRFKLK